MASDGMIGYLGLHITHPLGVSSMLNHLKEYEQVSFKQH